MATLLWLDDVRPAPDGWAWARSVNEAIDVLAAGGVTHASLDHDLGDWAGDGGDAVFLLDFMAEHDIWPSRGLRVHSSNPVGAATMLRTAERYGPYARGGPGFLGEAPAEGWPSRPSVT